MNILNTASVPQVITVSSVPGMDSDWLMGERGNQKGKVPITYLELLNWDPQTAQPPTSSTSVTSCDLIFILCCRDRPLFLFHSVIFRMSFISMKRSLGRSRLELEWIHLSEGGKDPIPDVFVRTCSTFSKPCFHCLCVWCHAICNMCQNISQTSTFVKKMFLFTTRISDGDRNAFNVRLLILFPHC